MTALLLLAGCLGTDEADEVVEDALSIIGCGDETSLTYVENVTNSSDDLCVYEDVLENTIVDFISLIEDGPDMETLDSTIGYSMELSEIYVDMDDCMEWEYWNPDDVDESLPYNGCPDVVEEQIHYMETIIVSPTGYKATMVHTIDDSTETSGIIISGNEFQYHFSNDTEDYTVRMKHAGTFDDAMDGIMSDDDEDEMDEGDDEMVCYDMNTHMVLYEYYDQTDCESDGYMWVPEDSGPSDDDDYEMEEGEMDASEYTQYFNPLSATITGFAPDETGYTFSGMLNIDDAPFSHLEIHTDSEFNVLGFTMESTEEEDNWVEFMMINSGDIETDETISLSALPYLLLDMSEMSGDDEDESDDVFTCDDGETIPMDWVNDGGEDCAGGEDEMDTGGSDDEFTCDDGETIPWDYVNDGYEDCNGGEDEGYVEIYTYDHCADDEEGGLSSLDCWLDEWDTDNDGTPEYNESYWNYECEQLTDGTWECTSDHINYYDHCEYEGEGYYECWLDEWDTDNDGDYDLGSDGYMDYECEQLADGRWACSPADDEEELFQNYDNCDDSSGVYECWDNDWVDSNGTPVVTDDYELSDCTELEDGTWDCLIEGDDEEGGAYYHCVPFVESNSAGFSIYDNSSLDESMCGMDATNQEHEFDNSTFTMPQHLTYESCWEEENQTVCEQGDITFDNETSELWETTYEENYTECDGAYDNSTNMCTEWAGNVTNADGTAFIIEDEDGPTLVFYQYDESTQSGMVIFIETDYDSDMSPEEIFAMLDTNEDGEVTASEWADIANQSGDGMSDDDWNGLLMMIEMYDDDNSSGLDFDEFVNMMESWNDEGDDDGEMDPETMFYMLDGNEDGEVTASEWSDFSNSTEEPMSEEDFEFLSGMIDSYDDDESGGLDYDEFITFMSDMDDMEGGDEDDGEDVIMFMAFGVMDFLGADVDDYNVELAMCDGDSLADMECSESVYSVSLADIMYSSEEEAMWAMMTESVVFVDSDESGTLTSGDFVMVNNATIDVDGEWNFARLHSSEAGAYSDENPMMSMLPGFTGFIATIGLLGAALIRRE